MTDWEGLKKLVENRKEGTPIIDRVITKEELEDAIEKIKLSVGKPPYMDFLAFQQKYWDKLNEENKK